ncbi:MAG TPA: RDD family protein [Acidimicrobiales bacterium]
MSAYQFPAATAGQPPAVQGDPTAVMGRRIGAWVVDFAIYLLIGAFLGPTPLSPLAEYVDTDDLPGIDCEVIEADNDVSTCVEIGDRLYFTEDGDAAIALVVLWLAFPLAYAAVQGATGSSPGKALFGVRVVDERGGPPGFGRSLARTALWAIDLFPWCIPGLLGFVTGLTTPGHRRIGDMAAKTFVVSRAHTGPVVVPGLTTAGPPAGYGPPGQPWGPPPPGAPAGPQAWGPPPSGPPGAPAGPPTGAPPFGPDPQPAPADRRPEPPSGWAPPGAPSTPGTPGEPGTPSGEWRAPEAGRPAPPGESAAPSGPAPSAPSDERAAARGQAPEGGYNPQWDAARGTYILWEPNRGKWLGWDEAAGEWKPL